MSVETEDLVIFGESNISRSWYNSLNLWNKKFRILYWIIKKEIAKINTEGIIEVDANNKRIK